MHEPFTLRYKDQTKQGDKISQNPRHTLLLTMVVYRTRSFQLNPQQSSRVHSPQLSPISPPTQLSQSAFPVKHTATSAVSHLRLRMWHFSSRRGSHASSWSTGQALKHNFPTTCTNARARRWSTGRLSGRRLISCSKYVRRELMAQRKK